MFNIEYLSAKRTWQVFKVYINCSMVVLLLVGPLKNFDDCFTKLSYPHFDWYTVFLTREKTVLSFCSYMAAVYEKARKGYLAFILKRRIILRIKNGKNCFDSLFRPNNEEINDMNLF